MGDILVIAGSRSDQKIVDKVTTTLDDLKIQYQVEFASAHREPKRVEVLLKQSDAQVIIAVAGLAAALPGYVASLTEKPVIGVPVSVALGGLDALLSIAQMPKGVPVATVGIDNGQNAAHLAARILGVQSKREEIVPSSYADAGVDETDVAKGLKALGKYVKASFEFGEVMQDYGHYANTIRVSDNLCVGLSTDGVGSKILIAELAEKYDTIGIDCVAMNVNDLICVGLRPIGFVDYLAAESPLPSYIMEEIGKGLLEGCKQSGIPILGGETAILPDMIKGAKGIGIDLAGTAVGIAKPSELIDESVISEGDVILGIESNGIHSNGFTLARKVILSKLSIRDKFTWGTSVADELLRPTKIYVKHLQALRDEKIVPNGIAHITGTGFKKVLRLGMHEYELENFPEIQPIFSWLQKEGTIDWTEMFGTFNMGIGMVLVVSDDDAENAHYVLSKLDNTYRLGNVKSENKGVVTIPKYGVGFK